MFYSPFKDIIETSDIQNLTYFDLDVLKSQDECYYVEYKSKYDKYFKEKHLPKAVCAFSNRNGGWLFLGVNNNGIVEDVDLSAITKESLYSIISSRVQPMPHVDITVLENPQKSNFGVVVFYVSEGKNTPFIANGTVYVRNGNESVPADHSALDLLIKKGYDYSNISLKCVDARENEFGFSERQYGDNVCVSKTQQSFNGCVYGCQRIALYLQNDGKHFDENVELTIRIPEQCYFDICSKLRKNPVVEYEDYFNEFTSLPATREIVEYVSPKLSVRSSPPQPFIYKNQEYALAYMDYLFDDIYGDFQVIRERNDIFIKIIFKEINPQQKMFLPAMLLCTNSIDRIEYTITSKYSISLVAGALIKKAEASK